MRYTILAAKEGGYVVYQDPAIDSFMREILFAGNLDQVLSFIRGRLGAAGNKRYER